MTAVDTAVPAMAPRDAWMQEWRETERAIHCSVRGKLPTGVEPADISQQVFVHLLRAGRNAPPPDRLRYWAVAVARRVVADLYRRKSVRVEDLAQAPVVDIESIALARLRCEAAAAAYAALPLADRAALADSPEGAGPAPNKTKLRRSRARRTLREKAERLVGGALLLPRWGWLAGTTGAVAVLVPLCLGLGGPGVDTAPDTDHRTPLETATAADRDLLRGEAPSGAPAEPSGAIAVEAPASPPSVSEPTYHRRIEVSIPGAGPAGYDHYSPAPGAEPAPLACAQNPQVSGPVCVEHPLR